MTDNHLVPNTGQGYLCAMIKIHLRKKISRRVADGHPWVFANEVDKVEGKVEGGEIVTVFTYDNKFVGRGYINPKSQILVRLLTRDKNDEVPVLYPQEFLWMKKRAIVLDDA